jgi:hypothetical protein
MIDAKIANGLGVRRFAEVTEQNALKVSVLEQSAYVSKAAFFVNDTYGADMAVNASPSGTPEKVHNGLDDVLWTASALAGSWIFDSTDQARSGSKSVDGTGTTHNGECSFLKSSLVDLGDYVSITGWLYLTNWPVTGTHELQIQAWDTATGAVGSIINLGNYVDIGHLNEWHKFTIPFSDMGLVGADIDSLRIKNISIGAGSPIDFYLDDLQIESVTGNPPREYFLSPKSEHILYVDGLSITIVDTYDPILADSTMPKLSFDRILGRTFDTGMVYRRVESNKVLSTWFVSSLFDFLSFTGMDVKGPYSDGVNTIMQFYISVRYPFILDSRKLDHLSILISEDFSVFNELKWGAMTRERSII